MTEQPGDAQARPAGRLVPRRALAGVTLLTAGVLAWAALPAPHAAALARPVLILAVCFGAGTLARLAAVGPGASRPPAPDLYQPLPERIVLRITGILTGIPWAQLLIIAVLASEAMHSRRAWHTIVLGFLVLAFVLVLQLAESGARLGVYRPQLPLLGAGVALAVLSAAAAGLPAGPVGLTSAWLAVLAGVAALVALALALPL